MRATANAAIEVGARSTRKGAKLHATSGGCYWANLLPLVGKLETLTTTNADRCCRNCAKAIRTAIDTARDANKKRCATNHTVKIAKDQVEGRMTALAQKFRTAAEIARHAELLGRAAKPVEVAPVATPLSKFGQAAANAGYAAAKPKRTVTRKSKRSRLALHASFANAA